MNSIPSFEEHCRVDANWNSTFDKEIFYRTRRWFAVKKEVRPLFKKKDEDCNASEAQKKVEYRKAVKEKCIEFMKDAKQIECIGAGTFGEVWTMKLKDHDPLLVQKICRYVKHPNEHLSEIYSLCYFNSDYIPKLVYSGYTNDGKLCTVMQYFSGGTLGFYINEEIRRKKEGMEPKINDQHKKFIAYHLARAIEYIHSKEFTHGDLKTNNIVLTKDGGVRLIDFGHSLYLKDDPLSVLPSQVVYYSSPEVLKEEPAGLTSDWWPFAVIVAELYQLKMPFEGCSKETTRKLVLAGEPDIEDVKSEAVKELIKKLLVVNPELRPKKVSDDAFFADVNSIVPFQPGDIKCNVHKPSKAPEYFSNDPSFYEILEAETVRIPSAQFLTSECFKSL